MKSKYKEKNASRNNINDEIRAREVTLIDAEGNNRGSVNTREALKEAQDQGLDLVEMSSKGDTTVCRIMDYGKFQFDAAKKKKQSAKDSKAKNDIKEIRLRPAIDEHDLQIKAKQARKFLESGKKVKIDVRLRGRERRHPELAKDVVDKFVSNLEDVSKLEVKGTSFLLVPN